MIVATASGVTILLPETLPEPFDFVLEKLEIPGRTTFDYSQLLGRAFRRGDRTITIRSHIKRRLPPREKYPDKYPPVQEFGPYIGTVVYAFETIQAADEPYVGDRMLSLLLKVDAETAATITAELTSFLRTAFGREISSVARPPVTLGPEPTVQFYARTRPSWFRRDGTQIETPLGAADCPPGTIVCVKGHAEAGRQPMRALLYIDGIQFIDRVSRVSFGPFDKP